MSEGQSSGQSGCAMSEMMEACTCGLAGLEQARRKGVRRRDGSCVWGRRGRRR